MNSKFLFGQCTKAGIWMKSSDHEVNRLVDRLFRTEYGKMVSYLTSKFGFYFLEDAQDVVQETLEAAFKHWSFNGIPVNPEGWIYKVAKNKAINLLQKDKRKLSQEYIESQLEEVNDPETLATFNKAIEDSMLRMIFACCSTTLTAENQIILILSTLCGFSRKEISQAFLTEEETIKKKLYRSKKKIRETDIKLEIPQESQLIAKLTTVCETLYLLFNEGYNSSSNKAIIRKDICVEAMRLTQLLHQHYPEATKINALFALMCFHVARFESRIDDKGAIILFMDQDRNQWNRQLINAGISHLSAASEGSELSSYHVEAGIAMQHCTAQSFDNTNWSLIHKLYCQLYQIKPSPIILLNLAIVNRKLKGVDHAIKALEGLKRDNKKLKNYYLLYATLGEFYKEKNDNIAANKHFNIAISLTKSKQEKQLLNRKMA